MHRAKHFPGRPDADTLTDAPLAGFAGGVEWIVDASGCDVEPLRSLSAVESLCGRLIDDASLTVIGDPLRHAFPGPGGVTLLYLLSESHLSCHTYPEHHFATFNLYCCRRRRRWPWEIVLGECLGARHVDVRQVERRMHRAGSSQS